MHVKGHEPVCPKLTIDDDSLHNRFQTAELQTVALPLVSSSIFYRICNFGIEMH